MEIRVKEVSRIDRRQPRWTPPTGFGGGRGRFEPSHREFCSKPRVYVSVAGETIVANFAMRFDRPHALYRAHALPAALEALGLPASTSARWSQKAGCSCGCSPGFIVGHDGPRADVWVTLEGVEQEVTPLAVSRVAELASDPTIRPLLFAEEEEE